MLTADEIKNIPLDQFRECIANALYQVKAHTLPAVCTKFGLASGDESEAFSSKRYYVINRLSGYTKEQLIQLATAVLHEYEDTDLADLLSEITTHAEHRVSEITRRALVALTDEIGQLFGDANLYDELRTIYPGLITQYRIDPHNPVTNPHLGDLIEIHYGPYGDWSNSKLLIKCHAHKCTQERFFKLLEKLLDPLVRQGKEQKWLVTEFDKLLCIDNFCIKEQGYISGHPVYAVRPSARGVAGKPKNLIFASINRKPDIYFTDSINNDIAIRNESDALIYDRPLNDQGLLWSELANWWKERNSKSETTNNKSSLYQRLLQSINKMASPGEYVLFCTYYHVFKNRLGNKLPALIPQVYLHYDPRTFKERNGLSVLSRERMDFLLLLEHNVRIVIEFDGKQHYAEGDTASPSKYADMVREDRQLWLRGYELYRFGGAEFPDTECANGKITIGGKSRHLVTHFFEELFKKHNLL